MAKKKTKTAKRKALAPIRLQLINLKPVRELKKVQKQIGVEQERVARRRAKAAASFQKSKGTLSRKEIQDRIEVMQARRKQEKGYSKLSGEIKEEISREKRKAFGKQVQEVRRFAAKTGERIGTLTKRALAKEAVSRRVLRKAPRATVVIRQPDSTQILHDPNRFFKDEYQEDKRSFFFK